MDAQKSSNSVRALFVRSKANEGVIVQLDDVPGFPQGAWMRVRGSDSDAVQDALLAFYRSDTKGSRRPFDDIDVVASMVSEWSFDEPATVETVREAFAELPSRAILIAKITDVSLERDRFLPQPSADSSPGQKSTSDSPASETTEPVSP